MKTKRQHALAITKEALFLQYDFFILDIWGTIHDGHNLLPGAAEFLAEIENFNKGYALLSNVPRPASVVQKKLKELGLRIPDENIITSGDFFLHEQRVGNIKGNAYVIEHGLNKDLLSEQSIPIANSINDANYILYLAFADDESEIKALEDELRSLAHANLPLMCVNPDIHVYNGNKLRHCQGYFARFYESLGGAVHYFGKPDKKIYSHLFDKFSIDKTSAIMLGDSLSTDIQGANQAGIDSILLLTGLLQHETDVANLLKLSTNMPTYVLPDLKFEP